jgi:hypothetical protein
MATLTGESGGTLVQNAVTINQTTPTPTLSPVSGLTGFVAANGWANFDGSGGSTLTEEDGGWSSDEGTISLWARPELTGGSSTRTMVFARGAGGTPNFDGGTNQALGIFTRTNGSWGIALDNEGVDIPAATRAVPLTEWHHLAFTWDRNTGSADGVIRAYFDGALAATDTNASWDSFTMIADGRFGKEISGGRIYAGSMDEMAIWTRELTADEIVTQYRAAFDPQLIVRYNLDDGTTDESATSTTSQTDAADVVGLHVGASTITSGPGWGREDPANGNNSNVGNGTGPESQTDDNNTWWARGSTLPNDIDTTHFAAFTVTPESGWGLDLTEGELEVKFGATDRNEGGTLEFNITVRSSVDEFTSDLGLLSITVDNNSNDPEYLRDAVSLAFPDLITEDLEFRLYFDDNSGSANKHPLLDTVSLLGRIKEVPEPSTLGLVTIGLLSLGSIGWRRRRR